jgi:hypothetical protein
MADISKVALFTNEYPPHVYGGAGVHVEYLSQELSKLVPVEVRCFGKQDVQDSNLRVKGYAPWSEAKVNTPASCIRTPGMSNLPAFWPRSCGASRLC